MQQSLQSDSKVLHENLVGYQDCIYLKARLGRGIAFDEAVAAQQRMRIRHSFESEDSGNLKEA